MAFSGRLDIEEKGIPRKDCARDGRPVWLFPAIYAIFMVAILACSLPAVVQDTVVDDIVLDTLGPIGQSLYLLAAIGGALLLFAGWKIYRFVVALPGFFIGAMLGVQIAFHLEQSGWIALLALLVGGMIGAWLALAVHDLAIFVIGAVGGILLADTVWGVFSTTDPTLLFEVGAGIVGGILLLTMARAWMMLLSAAVGAVMFVWGVQISLVYAPLFFILGIVVQSLLSRAMGERAYEQAPEVEHPPMINE